MKPVFNKKSRIFLICLLVFVILIIPVLTGCGQVKEFANPITENILAGISQGDYSVFSRDFDERMKAELPEENWESLLAAIDEQFGAYKDGSLSMKGFNTTNNVTTVNYTAEFTKKASANLEVTFEKIDDRHFVIGFWLN